MKCPKNNLGNANEMKNTGLFKFESFLKYTNDFLSH